MTTDEDMAGFEAQFDKHASLDDDVVLQDTQVIPSLDAPTLLRRFTKVEYELREMGEMMHAKTDRGRELHSARAAMLIELKKRRLR